MELRDTLYRRYHGEHLIVGYCHLNIFFNSVTYFKAIVFEKFFYPVQVFLEAGGFSLANTLLYSGGG